MKCEITIKKDSRFPIELFGYGDSILLTREEAIDLYSELEKAIHKTGDSNDKTSL
jgi:hypothetical protein